jgi:hypothetical protein
LLRDQQPPTSKITKFTPGAAANRFTPKKRPQRGRATGAEVIREECRISAQPRYGFRRPQIPLNSVLGCALIESPASLFRIRAQKKPRTRPGLFVVGITIGPQGGLELVVHADLRDGELVHDGGIEEVARRGRNRKRHVLRLEFYVVVFEKAGPVPGERVLSAHAEQPAR